MEHFLKSFSVIDFLGIFTPGALVTLAYNAYFGGVAAPFTKFFDDQSLTLVIYFVFLAYLVGVLLQELSKPLEKIFAPDERRHAVWQRNPRVQEMYKKIFQRSIAAPAQEAAAGGDPENIVWRNIYEYVQPDLQQVKIPLFHGFASMARSCCAAALLIMAMNFIACGKGLVTAETCWITNFICMAAAWIMFRRCRRFCGLVIEYSYISFVQMDGEGDKKQKDAEK